MPSLLLNILDILQRPKVLVFLSVITIAFFLYRSKQPVKLKAHVDFKGIKRDVFFEKGDEVKKLRYFAMVAFWDLHLDKVPPACVKLVTYDGNAQYYVTLSLDAILEEDVEVHAKLPTTQEEMVSCGMNDVLTEGPELYHPIVPNVPYRFWNQATHSLLLWSPGVPDNLISCNGSLGNMNNETVFSSMGAGKGRFAFIFYDDVTLNSYIVQAANDVNIVAPVYHNEITSSMKFEPSYYWSFTMFRSLLYTSLYLGCSNDGRAILIPMDSTSYPDPRALFIANKYIPPTPYSA